MKFKVFLLTACFLFIATTVFAAPFWTFHTGHTIKYTRAKSDGTSWLVTMTVGAGGQSKCGRNDYYAIDEYNYDDNGVTETKYLRVTDNAGYECRDFGLGDGPIEYPFFQTGTEGNSWQKILDVGAGGHYVLKFQVVNQTKYGTYYVIRRHLEIDGVPQPNVFNHFQKGFGLVKETDQWVGELAPWTQARHGYRGRTLYANITGAGLYTYDYDGTGSWQRINTSVANKMVSAGPILYATFTGSGLYLWDGTTWRRINSGEPADMVAIGFTLYATFTGSGLYKFTQDGTWTRINAAVPANMVASGTNLYATFTGSGLYKYDGTTWTRINSGIPASMLPGRVSE